jgi:hypothetical protein
VVNRKDYHRFAGHRSLYGCSLQMGQTLNGYWLVDYATSNYYGCAAPKCWSVCAEADIIGKQDDLIWMKKCFTQ